jgi:hypothetical protein
VLGRLYRRLVNTIHINRAFVFARASRDKEALEILERKVRDADDVYYVRLLKGQLYEKAGRAADALREYVAAHAAIGKPSHLSAAERAYFEAFAAVAAQRCARQVSGGAVPDDVLRRCRAGFDDINLRLVPGQVKAQFPLPEHPKWGRG